MAMNSIDMLAQKLQQASDLHRMGQLAQAQAAYEKILAIQPRHVDALNLLGAIAIQTSNPQSAVELFGKAIEIDPENVTAYCNNGWARWQLGHLDAALASYDRAIVLEEDLAEAHFNRGNVLRELGHLDAALLNYRRAAAIEPDYCETYQCCGDVLGKLRRWDEALAEYDHAIALVPDFDEVYFSRGVVLEELHQWDAALASYGQAIAIKSDYVEAHLRRGVLRARSRQLDSALASFDQAIALKPDCAEAHSNRGIALKELNQLDAALASFDQAIALKPDYAEAHSNRGNVLYRLMQWEAALASYDQAINLKPDLAEAYSNRGTVLYELKRWEAALASYDQAVELRADYATAFYNRSLAYLLLGDFERGWADHEWRWQSTCTARNLSRPLWLGKESIAGKTILLYSEQGLGDTLQFCRYTRLVSDLGARVILEVQESLRSLLFGLEGVSQIFARGETAPQFDFQCPLLSLPLAFKTGLESIPSSIRYLTGDAAKIEQWQAKLGPKTQARIGLAWSGSVTHKNDHHRSFVLADLIPHLPAGLQYVSLQKDVREADGRTLQSNPWIVQFRDELTDFSDTAALCDCLDLVISVDTSVAHLSAALGKNTWVLLPFVPDWRWLLDRQDSPWYPTAKLYRQECGGDWANVFRRIGSDLRQLLRWGSNGGLVAHDD